MGLDLTEAVVKQIETNKRIDQDFVLLSTLIIDFNEAAKEIYADLKSEQAAKGGQSFVSNCKLHVLNKFGKNLEEL